MKSFMDDEDYDEADGGKHLLGFLFGNINDSGDVDIDYLDQDAKEHLGALADKLGSSLADMNFSMKSSQTSVDSTEQDNDEDAEDDIDYQDIDEQFDGPENNLCDAEGSVPRKEHFVTESLECPSTLFGDENYDDDIEEDTVNENMAVDKPLEVTIFNLAGNTDGAVSHSGASLLGVISMDSDVQNLDFEVDPSDGHWDAGLRDPEDGPDSMKLPILCVEDGIVILRFSEIFGVHEPLKKCGKREHRYSIDRDKYKNMNPFDVAEEDEVNFLRDCCSHILPSQLQCIPPNNISFLDDSPQSKAFDVALQGDPKVEEHWVVAEPLNCDLNDIFPGSLSSCHSDVYSLDQLDWEDQILWDNPGAEGGHLLNNAGSWLGDVHVEEVPIEMIEKDSHVFLHPTPILLESMCSPCPSGPETTECCLAHSCHPQLLRLECSSGAMVDSQVDDAVDGKKAAGLSSNGFAVQPYQPCLPAFELLEESWLDGIRWDAHEAVQNFSLILDLQDEHMFFEVFDRTNDPLPQVHSGGTFVPKSQLHGCLCDWKFNIANDKFYSNNKISLELQSNFTKRAACGFKIHHSAPAIKLQTQKVKLSNKDLTNFHRPKAIWYPHFSEASAKEQKSLSSCGLMSILLKSIGGKGCRLHIDAGETTSSVKAKVLKKLDFKQPETVKIIYCGKELDDHVSLAEQNVMPNSMLYLVCTKIHMWPKSERVPGENKSLRPPGAFKKKSDLSVKDGHVFLMEYFEERPLLLNTIGMGANLCTYYQKLNDGDQDGILLHEGSYKLGNFVLLEPTDKSPFLGDIEGGSSQISLETNMYRAPVFLHHVSTSDFLLVRSPKGKLTLRRINRIGLVGQQEPLMEVFTPASKNLQIYMLNRLLVFVYRQFRSIEKLGLSSFISAEELSFQFPAMSEVIVRKKLKECALLQRDANGHLFWCKKQDFSLPSDEDLKKLVSPENVCAYESMLAGLYHLMCLGIKRLTLPSGISSAISQLPDEALTIAAAVHIERELQITPWNLSANYVACTNQERENLERLEITGVGDPSGRGLGFSFVRVAPKASMLNPNLKRKVIVGRMGSALTGTDADLRRLSMEAAREVLLKFNVPEEVIAKQTRWHRIAMIRKLSSEQTESGMQVDATSLSKYARGQRMSFLQLQQQTREKCQEIWDRQVKILSAADGEENGSDSEANSDLDSFAGDLENLLDAEECEIDASCRSNQLDVVKSLQMSGWLSKTLAEDEEDEAAEEAEFCRMLLNDSEKKKIKRKNIKSTILEPKSFPVFKGNIGDNVQSLQKPGNSILDYIHASLDKSIEYSTEVETLNDIKMTQLKTKVKILGDGLQNQLFKEKKPSRDSFACGACGQPGHMRTNKHCPRYGEEPEAQTGTTDMEKTIRESTFLDPSCKPKQKVQKKKAMQVGAVRTEVPSCDDSTVKEKVIPVKFKCQSAEICPDKPPDEQSIMPEFQFVSSAFRTAESSPGINLNKMLICSKVRTDSSLLVRSLKPNALMDPAIGGASRQDQADSHKPSIVIRPPANMDEHRHEFHKRSVFIRPPAEVSQERPIKNIVIRQLKQGTDLNVVGQQENAGFEFQKQKKIVELINIDKCLKQESANLSGESSMEKTGGDQRSRREVEAEKGSGGLLQQKKACLTFDGERGRLEGWGRFASSEKKEGFSRWGKEERREKKKKKRAKIFDLEDHVAASSKRMRERDSDARKWTVSELGRHGAEYAPQAKRRRSGEVGLANILEQIVCTLKDMKDVSYLFLKPVSKKEAPDYYDVISCPMDLSAIWEKVKMMEYKSRKEFRQDVRQIMVNAHLYNDGRYPGIPPMADQLLQLCDNLLREYQTSLSEAEACINSG